VSTAAHIVALGARTPVGMNPESAAAAINCEIGLVQEHPYYIDQRGEPLMAAYDTKLDQHLPGPARMLALADFGLRQLAARLPEHAKLDAPLLLSTPEPRPGFGEHDERQLARTLARDYGPLRVQAVHTIPSGHAGGLEGLHDAAALVASGTHHAFVVGGADSWLDPHALAWLSSFLRLPCAGARSAFYPGEGACFALVLSEAARRALGMPSLATIRSGGVATEPHSLLSGLDNLGHGLTSALRSALAGLASDELVDHIFCDLNGETYRTQEWGLALLRTQAQLRNPTRHVTPAIRWGDLGAATGTALAMLPILAWQRAVQRGYTPGPLALLFVGSDAGRRAAILLERPA
jgi:3-oxoacyl-[acyl-carrier-protein] synthase-1